MAKAKKLPSGNWRVLIYIGTDNNGKRRYKSITASSKKEAELMALEWSEAHSDNEAITVYEAVERYIDVKQGVLSPSTHRSYESILNTHFNATFGKKDLFELNNSDVQIFVSNLSIKKKLAPKSVRNVYGLLTSAIDMFRPNLKLKITLPSKLKTELYTPSDEDVKLLIQPII